MKSTIVKYLKRRFGFQSKPQYDLQAETATTADTILGKLINNKEVPGLVITAIKEGRVLFQKGYGAANLEEGQAPDPQRTLFRAASVSKPIAATALAMMVNEGTIDLDASFYGYVPYYPKKEYDFSIRQLAGHTAGIRSYKGKEFALNQPYAIKDSIRIFQEDPLLFEPGTSFFYNSYDWVLISLAMEEASGIPFAAYVKKTVLSPLGLLNTIPELPDTDYDNKATFYTKSKRGFRKAVEVNNAYKLAGGGYLSTSHDIAMLGQAYLDYKLVPQHLHNQFLSSQIIDGKPTYYGLGWEVSMDKEGRSYFGHVGNGVGGYSNLFVYPEQQAVISILINCTNPGVQDTLDEAISLLL